MINWLISNIVFIAFTICTSTILAFLTYYTISIYKTTIAFHKNVSEQIKFAVTPKYIDFSANVKDLITLSIDIWKINKRINSIIPDLKENLQAGLHTSLQKMQKYLSRNDIEILDHEGQNFNDGLNLEILSIEKSPSLVTSIVKETIEPSIIYKGNVVHKAKIILLSA